MKSRTVRRVTAAIALVTVLHGAATAGAAGGPSSTDAVATLQLTHDPSGDETRFCTGIDGAYEEIRSESRGTMTSPDPRLTGVLVSEERIMLNRTTLQGTIRARTRLLDSLTGETKMSGQIYAVVRGTAVSGVLVGTTVDGSVLIANASLVHDPNTKTTHQLHGELGGPSAVPVDLALLQSPRCSHDGGAGPFPELPEPPALPAADATRVSR